MREIRNKFPIINIKICFEDKMSVSVKWMDLCVHILMCRKTGLLLRASASLNHNQNLFQLFMFHDFMSEINFKLYIFML